MSSQKAAADPTDDDALWRKTTRAALLAARAAMPDQARAQAEARIAAHLDALLPALLAGVQGRVLAGYWPIRAEPDLRDWMGRAAAAFGLELALPVVAAPDQPLIFRPYRAGGPMIAGRWNIAEPAGETVVTPDIILAPVVGFDGHGYRMGYGGGFYDRTLEAMSPPPQTIGVGFESARLPTIHPQPHDLRLDVIVTERGLHHSR